MENIMSDNYFVFVLESAFRLAEDDPSMHLPTIPVHPIGYGIATKTTIVYAKLISMESLQLCFKICSN
jgi:hypothetical protein